MNWLRKLFGVPPVAPGDGDRLPAENARLPRDEAVALAEAEAARLEAPWRQPIDARLILLAGRPRWQVRSNWDTRGASVSITIDETGAVVTSTVRPR